MAAAADEVIPDTLVLRHGGPLAESAAGFVPRPTTSVVGCDGAASMERLSPTIVMTENARRVKAIRRTDA